MKITEKFNNMKSDNLKIAHFTSADVINNDKGNHIVLYSINGKSIDVIFYKSSDDYVNQDGIVLCEKSKYFDALNIAHLILKDD